MKPLTRSYVLVEVEHKKDMPDLADRVAGRVYPIDGLEGNRATAILLTSHEAYLLAAAQMDKSHG